MPLPITIPNTFANATATIPLSQLDNNFATVAVAVNSIGNGAFTLANAQIIGGTISNVTLDNVSVDVETLSNVTITNLTVNGNATLTNAAVTANTATITTANVTTANVASFISSNVSITGGSLDNVTIGSATAAAANVTNLTVNGNTTLGDANTDTILMTAAPSIGGAGLGMGFGFRNRIINGDMRIDQRNAGASVTITTLNGQYTLDRWNVNTNQASKVSVQQSTTVPSGFKNSALITSLSAFSPAAGDYFGFVQYVEGFNASDFDWGTANAQSVTLSFRVRASLTGTYAVAFGNSAGARSYVATFTVDSANTYETKTLTIPGDTSGTWLTDSGRGLRMWFDLGSGSTFNQASPNTWTASNTLRTSGSVTLVGTNGATFYITGVQLEKGSTATSFDYRPYGTELALCQRYYTKFIADDAYTTFLIGTNDSTTVVFNASTTLPVQMRSQPTISQSGCAIFDGSNRTAISSTGTNRSSRTSISQTFTASGGSFTIGRCAQVQANNNTSAYIDASAEL